MYGDLLQTKAVERVVEEVEKSLKTISDELMAEKAAVVNGSVKDEAFSEWYMYDIHVGPLIL